MKISPETTTGLNKRLIIYFYFKLELSTEHYYSPLVFSRQSKCTTYICTLNSNHFTHKTSLTTFIYILYSLSTLPVEDIISFNMNNCKATRSRWKLKYAQQVMFLYCIFSPHYIFLWPEDGPQWPKHVVSLIKQIQRQLCFDVPTPS